MVQGWTHEPYRTAESLPRISLLGMPNEESLVSQITESKIAYSQVSVSPSPSITEQARLPCKEMELSPEVCLQCRRPEFDPWVGKIPWRREQLPTPVFWPGEYHGVFHGVVKSSTRLSNFLSLTQREAETKQINSEPSRSAVLLLKVSKTLALSIWLYFQYFSFCCLTEVAFYQCGQESWQLKM